MRPIIYSATPKDSLFNFEEKSKYVVIKEYLKGINKNQKKLTVDLVDNQKFKSSDKHFLIFKAEKNRSENFQKYLKTKLDRFLEQNGSIEQEGTENFFESLEADGIYHFEPLEPQILARELMPEVNRRSVSLQNLTDETPKNGSNRISIDLISRSSSVNDLNKAESLSGSRPLLDLLDVREKSSDTDSLTSFSTSTHITESVKTIEHIDNIIDKVQSFLDKKQNNLLSDIEKHGSAIHKGFFNGKEKAEILLGIEALIGEIKKDTDQLLNSHENKEEIIGKLEKKISDLNTVIKDDKIFNTLSRYRGFSPFKCIATLWGGGRVKSIGYVNQLKEQLDSLVKDISPTRPAV